MSLNTHGTKTESKKSGQAVVVVVRQCHCFGRAAFYTSSAIREGLPDYLDTYRALPGHLPCQSLSGESAWAVYSSTRGGAEVGT